MPGIDFRVPNRFGAGMAQVVQQMQAFANQSRQFSQSVNPTLAQIQRGQQHAHGPLLNHMRSVRQHLDRFESVFRYITDAMYYGLGWAAKTALRSALGSIGGPAGTIAMFSYSVLSALASGITAFANW